jgi:hypothetical protein
MKSAITEKPVRRRVERAAVVTFTPDCVYVDAAWAAPRGSFEMVVGRSRRSVTDVTIR